MDETCACCGGAFFAQTLLVLKTFYLLGHQGFGFDLLYSFYRWIRTTGIGEVVTMDFGFTRVFSKAKFLRDLPSVWGWYSSAACARLHSLRAWD